MSKATNIVAIDGPAGAGKSTVARAVAKRLGFAFLDTGAMYRAATWWALENGVDFDDPAAVTVHTQQMLLDLEDTPDGLIVRVGDHDVSSDIRTPEVTRMIYRLDQIPAVRSHLVELQRAFGEKQPTVAEGRDIGTVVFPNAKCKIYMDAAPAERARRRIEELRAKGVAVDETQLQREMEERDRQNMTREQAPLKPAEDAVRVDTTGLTFEQVVDRIVSIASEKLGLR